MSLTISINYACKYRISFAKNYVFTKCGICYNTDTKRVIKQVTNSRCIGYVINGKFKSLTYLKTKLELIKKDKEIVTKQDLLKLMIF
jgi:hypothetical protein